MDSPITADVPHRVALIAPAYGETKENNVFASTFFAVNGFQAVRFDWSDHVGESDGEIFACTLSKMVADLSSAVEQCILQWPGASVGIVATSLAGRVALKMASRDVYPIDFLVCLGPVVNLRATLATAYREDLVGSFISGKRYGTIDVLGFSIDADSFLNDAIRYGFSDLDSCVADAKCVRARTFISIGERDLWVNSEEARIVHEQIGAREKAFLPLRTGLHRLSENPTAMKRALSQAVMFAENNAALDSTSVSQPSQSAVQYREGTEKAILKQKYDCSQTAERLFWRNYLGEFKFICNIHDYWNLLENVYQNLGGAWAGQKILDVGAGNANYAYFLLLKQAYRRLQSVLLEPPSPCMYYGVDFVSEAIVDANKRMKELQSQVAQSAGLLSTRETFLRNFFMVADIEEGLPFEGGTFDQVCCNLVISYLRHPQDCVREFCRVLRPGGKLLLSSLKPNADLSEVYRNFVAVADDEAQISEARKLLSNAGAIKLKEVRGLYQFYSEKELKRLVRQVGLVPVKALRSFGGQANVLVARKSHKLA